MAACRVVVAAVAEAVSELQSSEADSDQYLNEMLIHLTKCCQSSSSAMNIAQDLADDLGSGTSIKHFADETKDSCHRHCQTVVTESTRYVNVSTYYERATRSKTEVKHLGFSISIMKTITCKHLRHAYFQLLSLL